MTRTENRPLPMGELNATNVITFALILGISSMLILVLLVNTLTAILTFLSLFGYAIIYTLYLKISSSVVFLVQLRRYSVGVP